LIDLCRPIPLDGQASNMSHKQIKSVLYCDMIKIENQLKYFDSLYSLLHVANFCPWCSRGQLFISGEDLDWENTTAIFSLLERFKFNPV
jgi:hypothetical protein